MDLAVVRAVGRIGTHHFGLLPDRLEIILRDAATLAERAEGEGAGDAVFRVRRSDRERVAEFVERDLLFDRVGEFAANLIAAKRPLNLHATEALDEFFLRGNQFGLFVAEVETVAETKARDAVFAIERGKRDVLAERELG